MNLESIVTTSRKPVMARNVVATSQPLASQAGAAAFAKGGNAIDAALAAAITLTVVRAHHEWLGWRCVCPDLGW